MRVVFLDMDGVLNSKRFFDETRSVGGEWDKSELGMIDMEAVKRLNNIIEMTGAKVVISSSWRYAYTWRQMQNFLNLSGFIGEVIDSTPTCLTTSPGGLHVVAGVRGNEIQAWLSEQTNVEAFVILDDSTDMAHLMPRLVNTEWGEGLQDEHVEIAVRMLVGS